MLRQRIDNIYHIELI